MLAAETAILHKFDTIGIVLLIFCSVIVSLFAVAANECDFYSHLIKHLPVNMSFLPPCAESFAVKKHNKKTPPVQVTLLYQTKNDLSIVYYKFVYIIICSKKAAKIYN